MVPAPHQLAGLGPSSSGDAALSVCAGVRHGGTWVRWDVGDTEDLDTGDMGTCGGHGATRYMGARGGRGDMGGARDMGDTMDVGTQRGTQRPWGEDGGTQGTWGTEGDVRDMGTPGTGAHGSHRGPGRVWGYPGDTEGGGRGHPGDSRGTRRRGRGGRGTRGHPVDAWAGPAAHALGAGRGEGAEHLRAGREGRGGARPLSNAVGGARPVLRPWAGPFRKGAGPSGAARGRLWRPAALGVGGAASY